MDRDPDQLFGRWRDAGDPAAFGALFDATADDLFRVALRLAPDAAAAEDALMETFLAAMDREKPAPAGPVVPWLVGIVRNRIARARREGRRAPDPARVLPREGSPDPADEAVRTEDAKRVHAALDGLPEPYREVAILRWRYGLEPAEIADAKAMNPGTVRSLLSRASEKLKRGLGAGPALLLGIRPARGMAAIRTELVRRAGALAPPTAAAVAGGIVVTKKIAVLAALIVLLLAGVGTVLLTGSRGREAPPAPSPEAAHAPEPADPDQDTPVEIGTKRSGRPADREAGTPGARMEVIVLWSDAKPAAGVALRVIAWDGPDPLNRAVMVRTDENGVARAEGLAGRHVTAYVDRGGSASAKVTGEGPVDAFPSVVIGIDGGVDYAGTVVDPEGRRVPGAEVWLSDYGNTARGVPVATTDDTGRFFVRCVRNSHWLRARADGHEPSNWMLTTGEAGGRRELRLVLGGPGGRLGGVVTDAAGVPIPGARVVAGGRPHEPVSGFDTTSGPDGAFVLDGLPVGEIAVGARAPGHAPFAGTVVLEPGSAVVVEWRLPAGARIEGVVRNSAGEPAPDAVVTSGRYGDFTTAMACADAAGRYVLVDVPPGRHEFSASLDGSGRASRTTDVTEGEVLRWDPVLHEGAILSGRVVDETGAPWAGILVEVRAGRSPGGAVDWATTDRDGRFRVSNVAGMVDIVVFTGPEDGPRSVLGRKPGVRPADGEVEIVVDRSRTPSARLEGRVLDDAGAPIHGARVFLRPAGEPMGTSVATESNGLFSAGPLPPGGYAIRVFFDGRPALDLGIRTLSAGEARNLGDLSMPAAGRVRVRIRREDDEPVKYAWGNVLGPDGLAPVSLSFEGGEALSGPVAPGRYAVRVDVTEPDRSFVAECAVVVREGETAEFDLVLRPAVRRTILVATPDGGAERSELALRITNSSGERVVSARHTPGVILAFLPGTYTVEAVTDDGRRAERMVNVREADTAPIEITLPER